ncbi:MAG: helix-turn-helix domain-containing protein [Bacillota bacterium]|jgi:excisionase family DNA binding protein
MEELLTVQEVAEYLRVSDLTVRRMLKDGRLQGVNIGREWRIPKGELEAFIKQGGVPKET